MTLHSSELSFGQSASLPREGPVSLPAELIRLIAHHLQDDRQALHACLLVSRAWSQAAVEYMYKAEHMMGEHRPGFLSSLWDSNLSLEGLSLEDDEGQEPSESGMNAQQLLRRTLDASLLHDGACSYDYISYLNKISCPWFAGLIEDWSIFCAEWRGQQSRTSFHEHNTTPLSIEADSSLARQEHYFNRLVRNVSRRCTSVDEFRSSAMVHADTLIYAIQHLQHLTWLDLKGSEDLNDDVFRALSSTVRSLSYIRLPGTHMKNVSTQVVAEMILAQKKDSLAQFKVMNGTNIFEDDSILKALGEHHGGSMRRLTLAICDLEHSGLQEFGPLFKKLTSLNLEYTSGVTDDVLLPMLDACRELVKLDLTETECTQAIIHGLSTPSDSTDPQPGRFAAMKQLILNNIDAPFTTNLFLPLADACPNLEELHMNSILADSYQDFGLFIAKTEQLRDLDIGNVFPEFSDANLTSLVDALPRLRWLSIANTQITNVSLVYLAEKAQDLCDLCILGCDQVTKSGLIEFLDKMANKSGFRRLDVTYCRLDDGAVAEIRERAKTMVEQVEVEGDDQFTDSLAEEEEAEREDGEGNGDEGDEGQSGTEDDDDQIETELSLVEDFESDTISAQDSEEEEHIIDSINL